MTQRKIRIVHRIMLVAVPTLFIVQSNIVWHVISILFPLRWRHDDHDGVSNHQPSDCLLNRLFRRRSKKTSKIRVTGLCVGNSPGPVNSPHKGPVTRKMFPFDDVIMSMDGRKGRSVICPNGLPCFQSQPFANDHDDFCPMGLHEKFPV